MSAPAESAKGRSPHRLKVILGCSIALWFAASLLIVHNQVASTVALPRQVDQVVVIGVPGLRLDDLRADVMPNLTKLARRGAVGGANVRSGGNKPDVAEAYASFGAGFRIESGSAGMIAVERSGGGVRIPDMPSARTDRGANVEGRPGSLGEAMKRDGLRTAVISNADVIDRGRQPAAPAALAAADESGSVDMGTVGRTLTRSMPSAPGGLVVATDPFMKAYERAARSAELVVVDPGDTTRLLRTAQRGGRQPTRLQWRHALARTDGVIGQVARTLEPHSVVLVVGVTPDTSTWALTPVIASGGGIETGHLNSPSTHRRDLLTLPDLAPSVLSMLGVRVPETMSGHVLRVRPGGTSLSAISRFNTMLVNRRSTDQPLTLVFILLQSLLYILAVAELVRRDLRTTFGRFLVFASLTCAAWPLATFWLRGVTAISSFGGWAFVISWAAAAAVAFAATRFRSHPLDPLLLVCGLTVATIVLDLSTGSRLQYGSFFGYSPNKGTRFTGLGNAAFALLAGSTVVVCTVLVARARDRIAGWWQASAVALLVVASVGAPWLGVNVGALLTTVPIFGLMLWALRGRQLRWRSLFIALLGAVAVLAVAVGLDALRAPDQRTHFSRFFLRLGDFGLVQSTIAAKLSDNMRLLRESMWAWLVPITAACSLVALSTGRLWERALPPGSPQRLGVMATLAVGLVGWLLNDSGIVVVALASVYLGPYVLLLALADDPSKTFVDPPEDPVVERQGA